MVLSTGKEDVLFQLTSHLALIFYLWLRSSALAAAQGAVQLIDCPGIEKEEEKTSAGEWQTENEESVDGFCDSRTRESLLLSLWFRFKIPIRKELSSEESAIWSLSYTH